MLLPPIYLLLFCAFSVLLMLGGGCHFHGFFLNSRLTVFLKDKRPNGPTLRTVHFTQQPKNSNMASKFGFPFSLQVFHPGVPDLGNALSVPL